MGCNCRIECDEDRECCIEYCQDHEKGMKALQLWREWFEQDGDPSTWYMDIDVDCFFCGVSMNPNQETRHESNCIYVKAKKLVDGDQTGPTVVR